MNDLPKMPESGTVLSMRMPQTSSRCQRAASQRGLSLIELMVALTIGAFLVLGVTTVFLANKDSANLENSLARLQENARFALDMMRDDLYGTQFLGCNTGDVNFVNMIDDPNDPTFTRSLEGVRGYERLNGGAWGAAPDAANELLWSAVLNAEDARGARNNSDVLSLRTMQRMNDPVMELDSGDPFLLTASIPVNTAGPIALSDNPDCAIQQNSWVVITGCQDFAHMFEVTNAQVCDTALAANPTNLEFTAPNNFTTSINVPYDQDADVLTVEDVVWFVADTDRDRNGQDVWALYRDVRGDGQPPQEMIEGVEHMQVKFGQRVLGQETIRYVDPSDAELNTGNNYDGLISARIALLMQGYELIRAADDTGVYALIDEVVVPPAGTPAGQGAVHGGGPVQRDVFSTTVNLRNAPAF
ncbi:MAG: PilW family protein [Pseudomonadota bacterium]